MIQLKTKEDISILREGGHILGHILLELEQAVQTGIETEAGINSLQLENLARKLTADAHAVPAFLGYTPEGASRPYPAALCLSVNDTVVHGIPNENIFQIKRGDLVTLDMGISYKRRIVDSAVTIIAGEKSISKAMLAIKAGEKLDKKTDKKAEQKYERAQKLIQAGKESLNAALEACKHWPKDFPNGIKSGDIGNIIEKSLTYYKKTYGFNVAEGLGGHGVGFGVHEDPFIPNFGKAGQGPVLKPGTVIAIEPLVNEGTGDVYIDDDGYAIKTSDGKRSVHFEHTLVITETGAEVLTLVK